MDQPQRWDFHQCGNVDPVSERGPRRVGFAGKKLQFLLRRVPVAIGAGGEAIEGHLPILRQARAHRRHHAAEMDRLAATFVCRLDNPPDPFKGIERFAHEQILTERGERFDMAFLRQRLVKSARGLLLAFRFQPARKRKLVGPAFFGHRHVETLSAHRNERKESRRRVRAAASGSAPGGVSSNEARALRPGGVESVHPCQYGPRPDWGVAKR
ncbi:MAG TPA: hypothetical protein VHC42_03790 [Rhizomicrobium sp.]|nr:hypothetical protein [Rhizomicrobium sp.]